MSTAVDTTGFASAKVVLFESRRADVMAKSVARYGGEPITAPSLQEIPLSKHPEALAFGEKLLANQVEVLLCNTGVGTRQLLEVLIKREGRSRIIEALGCVTVVARGPKPTKVLREYGIPIAITVPEPNTWKEILQALDESERSVALDGKVVAVQEYGVSNEDLIKALKKRGAKVMRVPIYRWGLPDDTKPLKQAIDAIIEGKVQFAVLTSAVQIQHVLQVAAEQGKEAAFRDAMKHVVIASIGPTTTEMLRESGFAVDFEPVHLTMGALIAELAASASSLINQRAIPVVSRFTELPPAGASDPSKRENSPFLKACRREKTDVTPVWLMRQAGRYMKSYRNIRNKVSFLELCKTKELAAEVTLAAVEQLKADAAIIFSDILLIVEPMGLGLQYTSGDGPSIAGRVGDAAAVDRLAEIEPAESLSFVFDAVRLTRRALNEKIPLIGFSGAPFTLASYIIEGGTSRSFLQTKRFMHADPGAWNALLEKISRGLIKHLNGQIEAGADCVQIFDSWVGCLGPEDYREFVLAHTQAVIRGIKPGVPVIHFGTGTGTFLEALREAGGDVIGVDHRIELNVAWERLGDGVGIQGNLDPSILFADRKVIRRRVQRILEQVNGRAGHIFNLGHGVLPETPVENVIGLIEDVHELSQKK